MILGIPAVDGHELTQNLLESLAATVSDPANFEVVIIDNGSIKAYDWSLYRNFPFHVHIQHYERNIGYYQPLQNLRDFHSKEDLVGLIHNDMVIYTYGWDILMSQAFLADPKLGLIGLCGSNEIDERGGRGNGTMVNFMGRDMVKFGDKQYTGQNPSTGRRLPIGKLEPAVCLDSLFMMFKSEAVDKLVREDEKWSDITLAHMYDRIWPLRVIEADYGVGVMGIDNDHLGGMTTTANQRYADDCKFWLMEHQIPFENPETEMYLEAERRYLGEYRDQKHFIPCSVNEEWTIHHAF